MLVVAKKSKKNNKVYYSLIINKSLLKPSKNNDFMIANLTEDFLVGLENKKTIPLKDLCFKTIEVKEGK